MLLHPGRFVGKKIFLFFKRNNYFYKAVNGIGRVFIGLGKFFVAIGSAVVLYLMIKNSSLNDEVYSAMFPVIVF